MHDDSDLGRRLIDAVHAVTGEHAGHRALHARGVGATGTFTASGAAAPRTTAAHLQPGAVTPVTVRFSNGSGDPDQADGTRDGRGFATKFHLADGTTTDIVALTLPVFFVRTPDDFLGFMAARVPDPATGAMDLDKVMAFLGAHPEAQRAVELSMTAPIPASYACLGYHAVHAFWLTGPDGARTKVRYRWVPEAGTAALTDDEASAAEPRYLAAELVERLAGGPAAFTLQLVLGTEDDDETDPTVEWPAERAVIDAGRLELDEVPDDQAAIDAMIFDPTRVTAGIECSADAILHARSAAYGASYALRRTTAG